MIPDGRRFVTPEEPPPNAYNPALSLEKQMLQLARFVGLIPFLDDFQLEGGTDEDVDPDSLDVWCTSREFVDIMAGDWEEHATLLCNFFNYVFNKNSSPMSAYVVFGRGIPEGNTVEPVHVRAHVRLRTHGSRVGTGDARCARAVWRRS